MYIDTYVAMYSKSTGGPVAGGYCNLSLFSLFNYYGKVKPSAMLYTSTIPIAV